MPSRSTFLIIHRLSTLANCHIGIEIEHGYATGAVTAISNSIPCQGVA